MKTQNRSTNNLITILLFFLGLIQTSGLLYAQFDFKNNNGSDTDKCLSPYFFVPSEDPSIDQLPLKETNAEVHIAGVIADVQINQIYKNTGSKTLEAIYIFPASTRAAVYAMRMKIGEREIIAVVQEREKARRNYEQARSNGQTVSLLEEERPNVFRMNVANILPGDVIEVHLKYTELLIPENGIYQFVYPALAGPRYAGANTSEKENWVANPYLKQGEKPNYKFSIRADLSTGLPLHDLKSPSHDVQIAFQGKSKASLKLKDPETFQGDRDFILDYRLTGNAIQSGMILYRGKNENFFLAMVQPPKTVTVDNIVPREYIFIVDVSGSMYGFPLEISKKLMKNLLSRLRPVDRFNVVLFAGGSRLLSEKSLTASEANIQKAINLINKQQGGGGTELLSALKKAMLLPAAEEVSRTFVIATDGYVSVEKKTFDFIRNNLGKANFFSFGIGSSVNRYLIEGMAHVGKGKPFVITKPQEAVQSANAFRKYISSPVLTNIKVSFNGFKAYDTEPSHYPDVFGERPLILFGKWKGKMEGSVEISGLNAQGAWKKTLSVNRSDVNRNNKVLTYLWARERIRNLDDFNLTGGAGPEIKDAVTRLGLKYNLLTKYTSFLALDSEIRNSDGSITSVKQPLPLPQGVSNYAVGGVNKKSLFHTVGAPASRVIGKLNVVDNEIAIDEVAPESSSESEQIFNVVEQMPVFPGGTEGLKSFFAKHITDPGKILQKPESGIVYIQFTVDINGLVRDVKVIRGLNPLADREALRLIKLTSGMWKPGMQRGKKVPVQLTLPVKFKKN